MSYATVIQLPPSTEFITQTKTILQTVYTPISTVYKYVTTSLTTTITLTITGTKVPQTPITTVITQTRVETPTKTETSPVTTPTVTQTATQTLTTAVVPTTQIQEETKKKLETDLATLEVKASTVSSKPDLFELAKSYNDVLQKYKSLGVVVPDLEMRLSSLKSKLEERLKVVVQNDLKNIDVWSEMSWVHINSLENWLNTLKSYGVEIPQEVLNEINNTKATIEAIKKTRDTLSTAINLKDEKIISQLLDDLSSKIARLYTISEFISKDVWQKLKESVGLKDSDFDIIKRLVNGEKLDDYEVKRLSDLYIKLQTNPFLNPNDPIGKLIESELSRFRTEYAGAEPYSYYTLKDVEAQLKEKILKGEIPQVSLGRRVIWGLQDILKSIDVVNQGYNAFYNFLRERGLDPGIAAAIASAVVTGGIVVLGGIAPPIAAGLVGVSLANTVSQISEYLDEYERKLFTEEFSKILDPSKAPPDQRQFYEDARKELIGSLAGAVVGGLGIGKAASPVIKSLRSIISSKYPRLAEKLGITEKYLGYGELQAKTQDYMIYYDKDSGLLTIQLIEKGDITKPVATAKIPIQEYMIVTKGKSQEGIVGLVKTLRQIYGKDDVTDEVKAVLDRVKNDIQKLGLQLNDENVARFLNNYRNFLGKMSEVAPQELRGKSLTEIAERLIFVKYGDKDVPALDLGEKLKFISGDKVVDVSKGALASLEVTDRLKSLGVFDDVVSLLQKGIVGEKGVIVKGDRVVEVYPDGRLVITRGLQRETYSVFDPKYLMEARRLLENYDNELLKSLGKTVTAGYTTQPQLTPITQPADVVPDLLKNSFKVAGDYTDISLTSGGKTLRLMINKELRSSVGDETLLRYSWDVVYARDKSLLERLLGNTPGYERYRGEIITVSPKAREYLSKYISGKTLSKEELKNAVENALKEASKDPEAAVSLKQLQVLMTAMEKSPGTVVPIVVSDTGKELVIGVATATASLSKLTPEDIQKLGLEEKALVEGLRPVYIETTYPVPVIQPVEVIQPVFITETVEIPIETEESTKLKPIYVETPYPIPVVKEVEETKAVFIPESVEIPYEVSETIRLKPVYVEVPYQVPITQSVEITKPVYIPETIEVPLESSEEVMLKPVYVEEVYQVPVVKEVEKTEVITQPEEVIIPLTARQLADVVIVPVEIPSFITIYYPYSEPLPIPPEIPPYVVGVVTTPPLLPKPEKEELKRKGEVRKAREVEKVVL